MNEMTTLEALPTWEQMSRRDQLAATHYDYYKDVHGVRPRWMNYDAMTEAELEAELDDLSKQAEVVFAQQKREEEAAMHDFEMRMQSLLMSGAKSREMAVRWLHEAHGTDGDNDYLCYHLGLPYGYLNEKVM